MNIVLRLLRRKTATRFLLAWVLAWATVVLTATLFPFNFGPGNTQIHPFEVGERGFVDVLDIALNIVLFMPLGPLFAARLRARSWHLGPTSLAVGAIAFAFSLLIESLQYFLPSRDSSLVDVLANTAGGMIGVLVHHVWGGHLEKLRRNASMALRAGVLIGCAFVALLVSGSLQYWTRLSNWDPDFPLLIGNESTGDRPWRGRVLRVALSDVATPEALLHEFAAGDTDHLSGDSLVALDFTGKTPTREVAVNRPSWVWVGRENGVASAGLKVSSEAWLRSAQPPGEIARRIRASNEFSLRLTCASDSVDQDGPARILSYSIDTMRRNFTIGQDGPDLVFRLRTPNTGANGTRIPLVVPDVFAGPEIRDVLVTYGGSTLRAAVAGTAQVRRLEFSPGVVLASFYLNLQPRHLFHIKLAYSGVIMVPLLGPLAWLIKNPSRYFAVGLPGLLAFAFVLETVCAFASLRPFDWSGIGMSLSSGVVLLVGLRMVFRSKRL